MDERLSFPEYEGVLYNNIPPFGFDATWAAALMLNQTIEKLKTKVFRDGRRRRIEDFTYNDTEVAELLFDSLNNTNFQGVTGHVQFSQGDRIGPIQIEQFQACEPGWHYNDSVCYFLSENNETFEGAREACKRMGGLLAAAAPAKKEKLEKLWIKHENSSETSASWYIQRSPKGALHPSQSGDFSGMECLVITFGEDVADKTDCDKKRRYVCEAPSDYKERVIETYFDGEVEHATCGRYLWSGDGSTPTDGPIAVKSRMGLVFFVFFNTLAFLGVLLILFYIFFNTYYQNHPVVKLSSPKINNLIFAGCILANLSVFVQLLDSFGKEKGSNILCALHLWPLTLGFVLAFGSIFAKLWRVYRVVSVKGGAQKKVLKDYHLIVMVAVFMLTAFILLTAWQIFDKLEQTERYPFEHSRTYTTECSAKSQTYWIGTLVVCKFALLAFGAFLSYETRTIHIPFLNDSKYIAISIYNVIVLIIMYVLISLTLNSHPELRVMLKVLIIIVCSTVTSSIITIPKIKAVYTKTEQEHTDEIRKKISGFVSKPATGISSSSVEERDVSNYVEILSLRQEIRTLKEILAAYQSHYDYAFPDITSAGTPDKKNARKTSSISRPNTHNRSLFKRARRAISNTIVGHDNDVFESDDIRVKEVTPSEIEEKTCEKGEDPFPISCEDSQTEDIYYI